jgi:hypothetical protein
MEEFLDRMIDLTDFRLTKVEQSQQLDHPKERRAPDVSRASV